MTSPEIKLTTDTRGVATVSFQGLKGLNIMGSAEVEGLTDAIEAAAERENLRLLILTGAGEKAFIGGANIEEMSRLNPASARSFITGLHELCQAIRNLPVPVIAKVRGYCLGGGLEVAAACDLRACSEDAKFGMPEVKVGLPSVIEASLLPHLMGWGRAREIIYTGRIFGAEEALRMGLVEKCVPAAKLDDAVEEWADTILKCSPAAIRMQKDLFRQWETLPPTEAARASIDLFAKSFDNGEPNEYLQKFLKKS
ncbi:MAG: enoyl-CoA hydratase [Bdellovibrionota bacterium]